MKHNTRWSRTPISKKSNIENRKSKMGALIILTVLAGCFVCPAWGRSPDTTELVSAANDGESGPDIYVPYQDLVQLIEPTDKAMLMDRAEFEKLLAEAEANAEGADTLELGQVRHAQYSGTVSGEELVLAGQLEVVSINQGPVAVPLGFAQIGLTRLTLDGRPAPLGYDKHGRLTLIVNGKGTYQLEMNGTAKLEELSTGGMQFSIALPAAVAAKMKLSAIGDLEMHATVPTSKPVYDKQTDRTNVELTIGGQDRLTVVLLGNGRREDDKAILLGESAATISLTRSHQVMNCLYTVQVLRRGVRELRFQLPSRWTITEVTCPSLVRWSVAAIENESDQGSKILTVRLRSARVGTTALHIKATAFRDGQIWHSPRVVLADAAFQRGYLMVNTDEGIRVRAETLAGARREDTATASVPGIVSAATGRLYFHWGNNWSVNLELATVTLRRSIKERQNLVVSPEQVTLTGNFEVTAIERELFDISFVLPGNLRQWQVRTVQVNGQKTGFEYRIEDKQDKSLLRIELALPVLPEKVANATIILQHVPSNWHWPGDAAPRTITVPLIESQAQTVSGHISVSAVGDLDALPIKAPDELETVPVGRMASLELPGEVQYAYSYKAAAKGRLQLQVSRRRPRIAAEAVALVTVRPQGLTGDWQIEYTISRASAKRLYLLADKSLGEKIKITSSTLPISSKNIVPADEKTISLPTKLTQRYNLWLLNLDHDSSGRVVIDVHYERPLTDKTLMVPLVRPICQGQINELLAVQASEELAITINPIGVKEIDAIDLPPLPVTATRILAAYRLEAAIRTAGPDAVVLLETAVHETYRVPSALAVSGELTTYLDVKGGQRTEAAFRIANAGRQFLTIRLPDGAELWSLSVAGRQAKPQRGAKGDYQVALARSREPVPVRIVYGYRPSEANLDSIQLGGVEIPGVETNRIRWNVIPPPGYQITTQETKMQTADLARPTPAYVQVYNFFAENLFGGILLMPALSKARMLATDKAKVAWGEDGDVALADRMSFRGGAAGRKGEEADVGFKMYAGVPELGTQPMPKAPSPVAAAEPAKPPGRGFGLDITVAAEGRFTLPVDLVPTPGAGPRAAFTTLGTTKLIIGLTRQSREKGRWLLGFVLIVVIGVATALSKVKVKATLFVLVLSLASLMAIWWPTTTHFANGAFIAGICLLPFYLLIAFIRWLWPRLRLGGPINPKPVTAAGLLLLVLLLGYSTQTAQAAQAQQVAQSSALRKDDKMALPPVIIPYEGDPTAAEKSNKVLIPYSRFVKLWNQAHPQDPIDGLQPGTDISLADVRYRATVENKQLKILLTANISTYGKDWVVLDLPTKGLAVTEVTLDGKPAQWQGVPTSGDSRLQIQNSKTGTVLMLAGGISGRLKLSALTTPTYFGRRGTVSFSLPPLPAAVMTVVLPEEDLELEADQIDGIPTQHKVNGKWEWTVPLGMTRELKLRWLPKIGRGAADRTLSAVSNHDVYTFHWATLTVTRITYTFSAGEHDRFALSLPAEATLSDLKGANIRDYRQVDEKTIEGRPFSIIEVRLHRPAKKQYELTARWLTELPALDKPARLFLVRAADVSRESGTVTLHAAGGMTLKVAEVTGGRRVGLESRDAELTGSSTQPVAKYYWPYRPFSLSVQLSRPTVRPKVNLDQLVRINTDRVQLLIEARLKADRRRIFGADFALPKGYELLSVVGPAVENFHERPNKNGNILHVKLSSAERETTMALVLVRSDVELENFDVPTITAIDSEGHPLPEQQGRLAVQVTTSLDAQTVSSENIKSVAPRTLRDWLDKNQVNKVQFAYRYEVPNPSLQLNIRRQPTKVRVETFVGLVVKTTAAVYTYRLRYDITGSPLDHLQFRMPSEYAPLVAVESPAMRSVTQSDTGGGWTSWDVALVNEVTGVVDVTVNFALPIEASTRLLRLPRIETTAPADRHAIAAVQNISRHDISIKDRTNLEELPVSEQRKLIPSQMRQSLQYVFHSFEDDWSLSLNFTPAKPAARIQAVVDLLAVTTVIDRNGRCRYEARIALQNRSEQFMTVRLPAGLHLWSAMVAGQPVKPAKSVVFPEQTEVLIPLVKTSPGGLPYDVYLYFADEGLALVRPLNGITRLKPPAISIVGMPVMQSTWSLRLPSGYRYMRPGGNMSPVAGTVETLSLGIDARLKQLERLDKTYREIAGSSTQREEITRSNWDAFNKKLATEITQAQQYLESNRGEVAQEDYERLRSKLGGQVSMQNRTIRGNTIFVSRQQEQAEYNMNVILNRTASNPGVASGGGIYFVEKPEFIADNEARQIERLNRELQASEQQRKELALQVQQARNGDTIVVTAGDVSGDGIIALDADVQMGRILEQLSEQSAAQIDAKQAQLKKQLSELADGRGQRLFQLGTRARGKQLLKLETSGTPGPGRDAYGLRAEEGKEEKRRAPILGDLQVDGADVTGIQPESEESLLPSEEVLALADMEGYASAAEGIQVYVARGTYSLPVTLPQGQVRLDFARPMGEPELSILAVPVSFLHSLYSSLAVLGAMVILFGGIKIWPQPAKRPPISVKRAIIYIVPLVALTVTLGLLGLLISLAVILLIEAGRSVLAQRPIAKTGN